MRDHARSAVQDFTFYNNLLYLQESSTEGEKIIIMIIIIIIVNKYDFCNFAACLFEFHSDKVTNGTFTSPNFPGLYPRNSECHYLFHGKENERIYMTFPYFDVEGVPPRSVHIRCHQLHTCDLVSLESNLYRSYLLRTIFNAVFIVITRTVFIWCISRAVIIDITSAPFIGINMFSAWYIFVRKLRGTLAMDIDL